MAKLKRIASNVRTLGARVAPSYDADGHSKTADPWRKWYNLRRWRRLRWTILARDLFTCQWPGCGRIEPNTSKLVADHKTPHRGDPILFWDEANLWCLCESCHSSTKQSIEKRWVAMP